MRKNASGQKWRVFAFNRTTNAPVLADGANITAKIAKDYASPVAIADVNPTEREDGFYYFDLAADETNGDWLEIFPESSTANVQVIGVPGAMATVGGSSSTGDGDTGDVLERYWERAIDLYTGETQIKDAEALEDLTGITLEMAIDSRDGLTQYVVPNSSITKTGKKWNATISSAVTVAVREWTYSLRAVSGKRVYAAGLLTVRYCPASGANQVATPTASPAAATFTSAQTISLTSETAGASIYYTIDGSTPTTSSTLYTAPFTVSSSTTVKAIATKTNMTASAVYSGTFTIQVPFPVPTGWDYRATASQSTFIDNGVTAATIDGQAIQRINDITANPAGYSLNQSDAAKRPFYLSGVPVANKPAIFFPYQTQGSIGRRMELPAATVDVRNFSFYAIMRPTINADDFFGLLNLGSTAALDTAFGFSSEARVFLFPPISYLASPAKPYGNVLVLALTAGAADSAVYINRNKILGGAFTAGSKLGGLLGFRGDGYPFQGVEIYEFGMRPGRLTDGEVGTIVDYAAANYAVREAFDNCLGITGDSIMQGAFSTYGTTVPQLIGNRLGNTWKIAGHCQEGRTLAQLTGTDPTNMHYAFSGIAGRKCAVNQAGTNDIGVDNVSVATLQGRLATWVSACQGAGVSQLYATTILPRVVGLGGWTTTHESVRVGYNAWLLATPPSGVTVIDVASRPTLSNPANLSFYNADGTHITSAGQIELADAIVAAIQA